MKRLLALIPLSLVALLLDCVIFTEVSFFGTRPCCFLAIALAACVAVDVQSGLILAFFGGLLTDVFCNPYAGLTAAAMLLAVTVLYLFIRKTMPKKLLLFGICVIAVAAFEAVVSVFSLIWGARFDYLRTLLLVTLPSILLTALLVLPIEALILAAGKSRRDRI